MFSDTLVDLAQLEEIPSVAQADRLTVGETLDVSYAETSTTLDPEQNWYSVDGTVLDDASVEALISDAQSIAWSELLTAIATDEELANWNLTDDAATALTVYEAGEPVTSLMIGAADDSGNYYARLAGSAMVYTVSADSVSALLSASADALTGSMLVPLNFDDLSEAEFALGEQTFAFVRTETEVTVEATEETEASTTIEISVQLNGEECDAATAESLWSMISALSIGSNADAAEAGSVLLTLRAVNESGVSAEFTVCEYDAESYLVVCSDGSSVLTAADSIDKIIRILRNL